MNFETKTAQERIAWGLDHAPGAHVLSSSFGIQSAVLLHMVTRAEPGIPVILVDTGYLFPETYRFIDEMTERLDLNLHVTRTETSPAWFEVRHGPLWEQGAEGIRAYNKIAKVEPMERALARLGAGTWFSGLRRVQSESRKDRQIVEEKDGRTRIHPILDWTNRDVHAYLKAHDLPYHPLWEEGYVSVGDTHTTKPLEAGMAEEQTRFGGHFRECGLHT
ncbi:MAG: phosphoadenylyl-sulfate reductase [Rhodobacteraceae bacterium]|nr:phosphoadenylyl-sulfate reductase [Paracoccaceae bacterium]